MCGNWDEADRSRCRPLSPGAVAFHDGAPQRIALCAKPIADADRVALRRCNDQRQSKLRIDKDRLPKNAKQGKAAAFPRKCPELVAVTEVRRGSPGREGWRMTIKVRGL